MLHFRTYRFSEVSVRASATVGDALVRLARYAGVVIAGLQGHCDRTPNSIAIHFESTPTPRGLARHAREYALAHALECIRDESEHFIAVQSLWFAHARPRDVRPILHHFGATDLEFGMKDSGFSLSDVDAQRPLRGHDARLLATVEATAETEYIASAEARTLQSLVAVQVERLLPEASIQAVAGALHMTPRTLQRRLDEEAARFSDVADRVRERAARRLLVGSDRGLPQIAEDIGFGDVATFGRAFKRWTGISPGAYRRRR